MSAEPSYDDALPVDTVNLEAVMCDCNYRYDPKWSHTGSCPITLAEEIRKLRAGIERHRSRKFSGSLLCTPVEGRAGKYGCVDSDLRLYRLLPPRPRAS
jgi:hypothetical protein